MISERIPRILVGVVCFVLGVIFCAQCHPSLSTTCRSISFLGSNKDKWVYQCEDNGVIFAEDFLIYRAHKIDKRSLFNTLKENGKP